MSEQKDQVTVSELVTYYKNPKEKSFIQTQNNTRTFLKHITFGINFQEFCVDLISSKIKFKSVDLISSKNDALAIHIKRKNDKQFDVVISKIQNKIFNSDFINMAFKTIINSIRDKKEIYVKEQWIKLSNKSKLFRKQFKISMETLKQRILLLIQNKNNISKHEIYGVIHYISKHEIYAKTPQNEQQLTNQPKEILQNFIHQLTQQEIVVTKALTSNNESISVTISDNVATVTLFNFKTNDTNDIIEKLKKEFQIIVKNFKKYDIFTQGMKILLQRIKTTKEMGYFTQIFTENGNNSNNRDNSTPTLNQITKFIPIVCAIFIYKYHT